VDEPTRKKIKALLFYLQNEAKVTETASRLAEVFQLDLVIIRALAEDEGIRLRDTGEVAAVDPNADTQRMTMPPEELPPKKSGPKNGSPK